MSRITRPEEHFPFHRPLDALVTRREYLRLLVLSSFGLLVGTIGVALSGSLRRQVSHAPQRIASIGDVAENSALNFRYPDANSPAILIHLPGGRLVAYSQRCTHLSCAVFFDPHSVRLVCPCHEGFFSPADGHVLAGPPPRPLPEVELRIVDGEILAVGVQP
ncbi:MAG: Rieske (2Fe-2S) protein [Chloroflexota bacterium]|nr:MAG: Rieske (2Fe-2S) protein [Chloroflexota bacterium]